MSLIQSDSEDSLMQSKRRLYRRKYAAYQARNNIDQSDSSSEDVDNYFGFIEQVIASIVFLIIESTGSFDSLFLKLQYTVRKDRIDTTNLLL